MTNSVFDPTSPLSDIIYTPLDVSTDIPYNKKKLVEWCDENYKNLHNYRAKLISAEKDLPTTYPWDLVPVFWNLYSDGSGWINQFDVEFNEFKNWILDTFKILESDLGSIIFLKLRSSYTGWGFWHIDADPFGLRVMLDVDLDNEKLFVKKFKEKYTKRPNLPSILNSDSMHDELIECKLVHPRQSHILTCRLAGHATYTISPNKDRICMIIINKVDMESTKRFAKSVSELVSRSIDKYREVAIFY